MPAVHPRHRHYHHRAQAVMQIEHQGVRDVTSVFAINPPSTPATSSPHPAAEAALSLSLSPSATLSAHGTLTNTPAPTRSQTTTSRYPKPSPPTFLYPQPIVPPPQGYPCTMQRSNDQHGLRLLQGSLVHKEHYEAPTPLIAGLVFMVIVVVATWSVVVMLIHWRGTTTGMQPVSQRRRVSEQKEAKDGSWWTWVQRLSSWAQKGRYEVLRSADGPELDQVDRTHVLSSAHYLAAQLPPGMGNRSPVNPYLVPPDQPLQPSMRRLEPRGSAEWAEERRAFFSAQFPVAESHGSSSSHSLSGAELEDIKREAREAQGRQASLLRDQVEANMSWVDLGLAAVDGAVDKFAGKITRWTDDGGKDEALLLPLAKGKQD